MKKRSFISLCCLLATKSKSPYSGGVMITLLRNVPPHVTS